MTNSPEYINRLANFIELGYNISALSIIPAKRGYYGETWRLDTSEKSYFIKLDYSERHKEKYKNSLTVVNYLCDNGIDFISHIVKNKNGKLYSCFESAILGVFNWIDGENVENFDTKIPEYKMLSMIYPLTKQSFNIPTLEFTDKMANDFYCKWDVLKNEPASEGNHVILEILEKNVNMLSHRAARLNHFATLCESDESHFYITHGDAGGNFLVNGRQFYIIDWDEVMYSPLERDAWVMGGYGWARDAFESALHQNGIQYALRQERIAFFCYHMFFFYLNELLEDFILYGRFKKLESYFSGDWWVEERIQYADKI